MRFVIVAVVSLIYSIHTMAGYTTCNGRQVPSSTKRCPDGSIPLYTSSSITPYQSSAIVPSERKEKVRQESQAPLSNNHDTSRQNEPASQGGSFEVGSKKHDDSGRVTSELMGVWHTSVPGGVWQTPSAVPGYDLLHISPGVRSGDLTIDSSGRYVWNSYGGKTGRWVQGDSDYPIVLIDEVEGKRWRVGPDRRHRGQIFIWDGYVYYAGKR